MRARCNGQMSLYVSRRDAGATCTTGACISKDYTTTAVVICQLVRRLKIRLSTTVTAYVCANVTASANYFGCSGTSTTTRHVTTSYLSGNVPCRVVGQMGFSVGSQTHVRLRHLTLSKVRFFRRNHITIVAVAGRVMTADNTARGSLRNLPPVPHRVRKI